MELLHKDVEYINAVSKAKELGLEYAGLNKDVLIKRVNMRITFINNKNNEEILIEEIKELDKDLNKRETDKERIAKLENALIKIRDLYGNPYNPSDAVIIAREAKSIAVHVIGEKEG